MRETTYLEEYVPASVKKINKKKSLSKRTGPRFGIKRQRAA